MMKKLLILMLVLGLTSFANAGIIISVNGVTTAPNTTYTKVITLTPSSTITLDITNNNATNPTGPKDYTAYLDFECPSQGGFSTGTRTKGPAAGDMSADQGIATYGSGGNYTGLDFAEETFVQAWAPATTELNGPMLYIPFHCEKAGVTEYLTLWDTRVGNAGTVIDTLVINQIPEPMTLTLLGLGGLLLRRRK
jgi:hypothetical protein